MLTVRVACMSYRRLNSASGGCPGPLQAFADWCVHLSMHLAALLRSATAFRATHFRAFVHLFEWLL